MTTGSLEDVGPGQNTDAPPSRLSKMFFHTLWAESSFLSAFGLAVVCLLIAHFISRAPGLKLEDQNYRLAIYGLVAILFPALFFGVPLLWRGRGGTSQAAIPVRVGLGLVGFIGILGYCVSLGRRYGWLSMVVAVVLAVIQTLIMVPWRRDRWKSFPGQALSVFSMSALGWIVAMPLFLMMATQISVMAAGGGKEQLVIPSSITNLSFGGPFLAGFAVAFVLIASVARKPIHVGRTLEPARKTLVVNVLALGFIAFMSFRTDHLLEVLDEAGGYHHWGAWVGPADLVREGGWLLWDVPSHYGFLSVLPIAFLPTATTWQSFYLLQSLAFFVFSGGIFLLLRRIGPGWLNLSFALACAVMIPMFSSNFPEVSPGTSIFIFPNFGPYRYFWVLVLIGLLIWNQRLSPASDRRRTIMVAGSVCWLLGVLWSVESAVYCSGVWLPAFGVMVWQMYSGKWFAWKGALAWFALPIGLLLAAVALVSLVYQFGLGHLPDWVNTLDFVKTLGVEREIGTVAQVGAAVALLMAMCLICVAALGLGFRGTTPDVSFSLYAGLIGALLATGIYGYQRSYFWLHPVAYAILAGLFVVSSRAKSLGPMLRAGAAPFVVLSLTAAFTGFFSDPVAGREATVSVVGNIEHRFSVDYQLPDAARSLQALFLEAGVQPTDPVVYAGDTLGNILLPWRPANAPNEPRVIAGRHWIPAQPLYALHYVPPDRAELYTARAIARSPESGWLIQRKTGFGSSPDIPAWSSGLDSALFAEINKTHIPTRIYENELWQIAWYAYVGAKSDLVRPAFAWEQLALLPSDILVDGRPLNKIGAPAIWAAFGTGWSQYNSEFQGREMYQEASIWVYCPNTTALQFSLSFESREEFSVGVKVNGATKADRFLAGPGTRGTTIQLKSGWNELQLTSQNRESRDPIHVAGQAERYVPRKAVIPKLADQEVASEDRPLVAQPSGTATAVMAHAVDERHATGTPAPETESSVMPAELDQLDGSSTRVVQIRLDSKIPGERRKPDQPPAS